MKRSTVYLFAIPLIFSLSCSSSESLTREQRKEIKAEQMKEGLASVKNLLESGTYVFTAQSAQPSSGRTIQLNSTVYTLASKDQVVKAYLPYYGRAYSSHYSSDSGIKFEGEFQDYSLEVNDNKGNITVRFKVNTAKENFDVSMVFTSSGYGTVTVLSRDKQSISYYGYLGEMKEDYTF